MNALDWIRSKATFSHADTFTLDDGRTVKSTMTHFRGTLPTRMATEVRKLTGKLIREEMEMEHLRIGGQYRGDYGNCEYSHTVYEIIN